MSNIPVQKGGKYITAILFLQHRTIGEELWQSLPNTPNWCQGSGWKPLQLPSQEKKWLIFLLMRVQNIDCWMLNIENWLLVLPLIGLSVNTLLSWMGSAYLFASSWFSLSVRTLFPSKEIRWYGIKQWDVPPWNTVVTWDHHVPERYCKKKVSEFININFSCKAWLGPVLLSIQNCPSCSDIRLGDVRGESDLRCLMPGKWLVELGQLCVEKQTHLLLVARRSTEYIAWRVYWDDR